MSKKTLDSLVPGKLYRITPQTVLTTDGAEEKVSFYNEGVLTQVSGPVVVMALELSVHRDYHYLKCLFQERVGFLLLGIGDPQGVFRHMYKTIELVEESKDDERD